MIAVEALRVVGFVILSGAAAITGVGLWLWFIAPDDTERDTDG